MLVLSRKRSEELKIADNITIRVLRIDGGTVRLGIDAPQSVVVVRGELMPPQISLAPETTNDTQNDLPGQSAAT